MRLKDLIQRRFFSFFLLVLVVGFLSSNQVRVSIQVPQDFVFQDANQEQMSLILKIVPSTVDQRAHHHPKQPIDVESSSTKSENAATTSPTSSITTANHTQEHPVLAFRNGHRPHLPSPIPVVLWPYMDAAAQQGKVTSADVVHIEVNGVVESSVLTLAEQSVRTLDPHVVWVTDAKFPYSQWCTRLAEKARKVQEQRNHQNLSSRWPIFVVDFTDPPQAPKSCPGLEKVVGPSHVVYFKRSIVTDRSWNFTTNWLNLGHPLDQHGFEQTPLIVRTDIVEAIATHIQQSNHSLADLPHRPRRTDVAHHWPPSTEVAQFSNLRNRVSTWLLEKFGTDYQVVCEMVGQHDRVGRRHAQQGYIESMVDTKILVVAQRDTYEDHYRLYEALASGSLVMTDPMYTLPPTLVNGTHLLVYTSLPNLISLVQHYLQHDAERLTIAQAGFRMALNRHRSWHRIEAIILGPRPITTCDLQEPVEDSESDHIKCPFTVHTNEWLPKANDTSNG
jgi:hypothetical protein